MAESHQIAKILVPTLVALSASEAANPYIWTGVPATQVYLAGTLWFAVGAFFTYKGFRYTND